MSFEPSFPLVSEILTPDNFKFAFQELRRKWSALKKWRSQAQRDERSARISQGYRALSQLADERLIDFKVPRWEE